MQSVSLNSLVCSRETGGEKGLETYCSVLLLGVVLGFFITAELLISLLFNPRWKLSNYRSFLVRQRELLCKYESKMFSGEEGKKTIAQLPFWQTMFLRGRVQTGFSTLLGSRCSKEVESAELGILLHP